MNGGRILIPVTGRADEALVMKAGVALQPAFGHARVREFIFGGVTRTLLQAEGPSLFLSH